MTSHSCKNKKAGRDEHKEGEDIISTLPDALLTQILTFVPEAELKQTRILSKRWKYLWAFLPDLRLAMPFDLSIEEANKFHDFVDQTLALRDGMPIERFYLFCTETCDYDRVYGWLCTVVKSMVQKIELTFPPDEFRVKFCWNLFRTCDTLVELTLRGEFVLDVPEAELLFPCLKKLNLVSIVYSGDDSIMNLVSGCPVLEELFVERERIDYCDKSDMYKERDEMDYNDNLDMFKVVSHSLKRLRMSFTDGSGSKVVIDAPNLEYMYILDEICSNFTFMNLLSLVEAHIETCPDRKLKILLASLSSVKILTMTGLIVKSLAYELPIPVLPNLVKLAIGIDDRFVWYCLPYLFEAMPNLEHMTFVDGLVPLKSASVRFDLSWETPMEVPHCLQCTMKEITILNKKDITDKELPLIRYLLRHSYQLERLSFNAHKTSPIMRWQLSNIPCGSALCKIEFI